MPGLEAAMLTKRMFLLALTAVGAVLNAGLAAETYPTRPITMIVPAPPGGPVDAVARVFAERMRRSLGQPIIIENVSGAGGSIGTGRAARAKPDGYTIDLGILSTHVLNGVSARGQGLPLGLRWQDVRCTQDC
jgi:tripartite-type tricarboxylate transporter receptor subunit TctC